MMPHCIDFELGNDDVDDVDDDDDAYDGSDLIGSK